MDFFDHPGATHQQAIGHQPQRRDVDVAASFVDQIDKVPINVGIFAGALGRLLGAIDK